MTPAPSTELRDRVLAAARASPAPVRATVRLTSFAAAVIAGTILILAFAAIGGVHWDGRPHAFIVGAGAGWLAIAVTTTWVVLATRKSMLGTSTWLSGVAYGLLPAGLFGWALLWNALFPETFAPCRGRIGLVCLDLSLTMGSVPVLLLAFALRRGEPVRPVQRGIGIGAVVGAWTAAIIHFGCECTNPSHVALGHILPVVLLMMAGGYLGWRLLPMRRVRS